MSKKQKKIILILFILSILFLIYILATSKPVVYNETGNVFIEIEKSKVVKLENIYKKNVSSILMDYFKFIDKNSVDFIAVEHLKMQLLDLKLAPEFKNLHFDLVMAMDKMKNYLENGDINEKNKSEQLINEAKIKYSWLVF